MQAQVLRVTAFVLPWHRPPGQVWRRSDLGAVTGIASGKNKNTLAMTVIKNFALAKVCQLPRQNPLGSLRPDTIQ